MNFDDLDEVLDKLGPIEMWEEDHGKKKRVISHCRERFDLGVPTNDGDERAFGRESDHGNDGDEE